MVLLHDAVEPVRSHVGVRMMDYLTGNPGRLSRALARAATLETLLVLALIPSACAGEWKGTCDIRFVGTSTLHDFTGNVRCQPFHVATANDANGKSIIPGAEVAALAGEMDTDNKSRDRQMREMFQSERFPRIRGMFGKIDPETLRQGLRRGPEARVPLDFTLAIRDIERPVHAVASNLREAGAEVSFDVEYAVSLKDYRLVPPKALFGLVSVGDKITVKTAVRLEAALPK